MHAAALVGPWVIAVWLGASITGRYPVHFDGWGTPDRWAGPGLDEWYLLVGIASVVQLVVIGAGALGRYCAVHAPDYVNIPAKALFMALPPAARARCLGPMEDLMAIVALLVAALFGRILYGTWQVATGVRETLPPWDVFVMVGLILAAVIWFSLATRRRVLIEHAVEASARR